MTHWDSSGSTDGVGWTTCSLTFRKGKTISSADDSEHNGPTAGGWRIEGRGLSWKVLDAIAERRRRTMGHPPNPVSNTGDNEGRSFIFTP